MGNSSSSDGEAQRVRAQMALQRQRYEAQAREQELRHQLTLKEKEMAHTLAMEKEKGKQRTQLQQRLNWLQEQLKSEQDEFIKIAEELKWIETEIEKEEKEIAAFQPERADPNTKIIILIGMTGAGKSTFCNRLYGDSSDDADKGPFKTSADSNSCTQSHSKEIIERMEHKVTIIDTPGYNDSAGRDSEHCNKLCKYLKGCGGINAFILIRNGTQIRFDMAFQSMLNQYWSMFGNIFFEKLVIIATKIDGTKALQRFVRNNQANALRKDICVQFKLNVNIPVIPIGLDEYNESLDQFIQAIPNDKFKCQQIASPIDDLKKKAQIIEIDVNEQKQQIEKIKKEINTVSDKLHNLL